MSHTLATERLQVAQLKQQSDMSCSAKLIDRIRTEKDLATTQLERSEKQNAELRRCTTDSERSLKCEIDRLTSQLEKEREDTR